MPLIEWREQFSIGNASIDHEHQHMIGQINELLEQLGQTTEAATIEAMLGEIQTAISAHFALEELLMRETGYAEYEDHKNDHEDLLDQIHDLMFSFTKDPHNGKELLMNKLSDWFGHHFSSFDARLHNQLD